MSFAGAHSQMNTNFLKIDQEKLKQHAKKVVSDSPGLVDFAFGLVNSVLNLSNRQAGLEIATDTVANKTNIFSLATKNSSLVAKMATRFLYQSMI